MTVRRRSGFFEKFVSNDDELQIGILAFFLSSARSAEKASMILTRFLCGLIVLRTAKTDS